MIFCTLFDSGYLDKGLALYRSIERVTSDFKLYIFCFDDLSRDILKKMQLKYAVIIHHSEFEDEELLKLKAERSRAEYCWTCTSVVIEHVLLKYGEKECTYLDSDLYFYSDPSVLFNEIHNSGADVTIVEHRFKDNAYGRKLCERNGKYCVEFNYFKNNENGLKVLNDWKNKCAEWCYDIPDPERMGDQKYLNKWTHDFDNVHELQHLGGGVAPWNLEQYSIVSGNGNNIVMQTAKMHKFNLVFYHFQNIRYISNNVVNIKSQTKNKALKYSIYVPYLKEICEIREQLLKDYGFNLDSRGIVRSSNLIMGFLQKKFAALKLQSLSDVMDLRRLDKYLD